MRVYRYELEPGAGTPQHTHVRPYLLVAVTEKHGKEDLDRLVAFVAKAG